MLIRGQKISETIYLKVHGIGSNDNNIERMRFLIFCNRYLILLNSVKMKYVF